MERNLPSTSHEANAKATHEMREQHYKKIIEGLKELKIGNYEQIAQKIGMERHQVGRRLSEMERMQIVYKPGLKSATSSGRSAYNYSLTTQPIMTPIEIVDNIIENAHKPNYIQPDLF